MSPDLRTARTSRFKLDLMDDKRGQVRYQFVINGMSHHCHGKHCDHGNNCMVIESKGVSHTSPASLFVHQSCVNRSDFATNEPPS